MASVVAQSGKLAWDAAIRCRHLAGTALALSMMTGAVQAQTVVVTNQTELSNAINQANGGADVIVQSPADSFSGTAITVSGTLPTLNAGSLTLGGDFRDVNISDGNWTINRPLIIKNNDFAGSSPRLSTNLSGTGSLSVGVADGTTEVVLSGTNTYSGGTTIIGGRISSTRGLYTKFYYNTNELIFANAVALPTSGLLTLRTGATASFGVPLTQSILDRVATDSVGTIAAAASTTTSGTLNFSSLPNVSLGATSFGNTAVGFTDYSTVSATITPANNTYRLGGGDGYLLVTSVLANQGATPARLLITGGNTRLTAVNTYTGGTQVEHGTLQLGSATALGGTGRNLQIDADGGVLLDFSINQSILDRITTNSEGSISLALETNNNPLDFTNIPGVSLGGTIRNNSAGNCCLVSAYNGVITPANNTYRLGGNASLQVGSLLSGANSLVVSNGRAILTNTNTYTGATTIRSGSTLTLGNYVAGLNGSINNTSGVANEGTLQFSQNSATTFDRQISGTGTVTQDGTGAVTFSAAQTYTGSTLLYTTLRLAPTASIASSNGVSLLGFSGGTTPDLDILAGGNQTVRNLSGNGFVTLGAGAALTLQQTFSTSLTGVVRGTGNLILNGLGTVTLSGTNTYTGTTTVNGGGLLVTGSTTSSSLTTIANTATLGGTGTIGNVTVLSGGTLSPGNAPAFDGTVTPGTLTINGNLVLSAGSNFRVDVGATQAATDRVVVTGTASLAGNVTALALGGAFTAGTYTLLTANAGRTGTFNALATTPNNIGQLTYDANNVFLVVNASANQTFSISQRDALVFNTPVVTTNRNTAYATQIVGRLFGGTPLYDQTFAAAYSSAAVQNGVTAARAAITTAGGPGVIVGDPVRTSSTTTSSTASVTSYSLAGAGVSTTSAVSTFGPATIQTGALSTCNVSALPSAIRPTCTTGGTSVTVADATENFNTITDTTYTVNETRTDTITDTLRETWELNGQVVGVGTIHAEVQSGMFDLGGRLLQRLTGPMAANSGWAEGYAFRVRQSGRRDARGIAAGANIALGEGLSLAFGIDHGNLDISVPGAQESGDVTLTVGGAALRYDGGPFTASLAATYGAGNAATLRRVIGNSGARYGVRVGGVAFDMGYALETGGWTLRPVAGVDHVWLSSDAFTEGDTLGLVAARQSASRTRVSAGLEFGREWGKFKLTGYGRFQTVVGGRARAIPVAFAAAPASLLTMTARAEPDTGVVGARARIGIAPGAELSLSYEGGFGAGYTMHRGLVGLSVEF